jgi:hypothetical protein
VWIGSRSWSRVLLNTFIIEGLLRLVLGFTIAPFLGLCSARGPTTTGALILSMSFVVQPFLTGHILLITNQLFPGGVCPGTHYLTNRELASPFFILRLIQLQLSFAQQGMNLAVSEHLDLLIRKSALHTVRIVTEIIFVGVDVVFDDRFCRRRVQSLVVAGEVGYLKGLEVFLEGSF